MKDLDEAILQQLKAINKDAGQFVAGILSDDLTRDDQILFALRLVRLAEHIKERADKTSGMVIEGVVDDSSGLALPAGADPEPDYPGPADHG